jgi:hypothetical protein
VEHRLILRLLGRGNIGEITQIADRRRVSEMTYAGV